jgi:hypothetical protein
MSATYTRVSGDYNIVSVDPAVDNVSITTNSLNLTGNLHVSGNITYINVEDLTVDDPFITVAGNNSGTLGTAPYQQQGLVARTSNSTYAGIRFDNGTQQWQLSPNVYANGEPVGNSYAVIVTGNGGGSGSSIANGTSSVDIATANGNIVATANGNAVLTITEFGANFVGDTTLGNTATANYFIGDGSLLTNITVAGGTAIVNGNSNVSVAANSAVRVGVAGTPNVAIFLPLVVRFNNIVDALTFQGNLVTANYVTGNGSGLSSIVGGNVTGVVPYANIAYSVALANVSGIGNIASINLDGNASNVLYGNGTFAPATGGAGTYGNANVAGFLAAFGSNTILTTGNVSVGSLTASGVSGITGNLTVANIQIDTNKSIDVGNNRIMNVGYPSANTDAVTKAYVDSQVSSGFTVQDDTANTTAVAAGGTLELLGTANEVTVAITNTDQITFGLPDDVTITANLTAGNADLGNATISNYFIGNGSLLNSITGSNVSGQVANALVAGTVYTNAQPNITSVGSLSGLTVSNASGVVDFTNTANVTLGNVSNLHIIGGSNGQVLTTDGSGSLSWSTSGGGSGTSISNGTSNVDIATSNGNVTIGVGGTANVAIVTGTGIDVVGLNVTGLSNLGPVGNVAITGGTNGYVLSTDGAGSLSWVAPGGAGNVIGNAVTMGTNTLGNLVSNAVTLTTSTTVTDGITQLNSVLGKLVPPSPPNFPASQSIAVASLSSYRMTNYTQTDNTPGANKSVAGGTTVSTVRRASSYSTNTITTAGPGDSGKLTVYLNGVDAGNVTFNTGASPSANGVYSNLVVTNNFDYRNANANIAAGFWYVFSSQASGTVSQGWNEVYLADTAASNTNTYSWFYDSSAPGTPTFSSLGIAAPGSPSYVYSSTVPHYDNTNAFAVTFNVNRLSGNMYPTSDTFVTGTAGGAFGTPASVTYAGASITTPLAQNLYVSTGNASVSTTSTVISGFGASTTGPSVSVVNSYNTGTQAFTATLGANVLYKTGTVSSASRIEEANVFVGSTVGVGSGLAFRIANPGSTNTPAYTGNAAAFNSQSSTLETYDSTVVANVLKHDQTNYSTGYLPAGPNLSAGRTGTQYFTFKIIRTSVSKFDVKWSGNIAGLWVALPGSTIDSTSSANGWLSMSTAYAGSGIPGVNPPGNGSDGCALGGVAPLNSVQTNKAVTATFGTVSSSETATNEIYIRLALTSGQSVTALSLQTASN